MTPEQMAKLPKWAQQDFHDMQRERDVAVRTLNEFCDGQEATEIWVSENVCTGEEPGPSVKRFYLRSTSVTFRVNKEEVEVRLWDGKLDVSPNRADIYIRSVAGNRIELVPLHWREIDAILRKRQETP